MISSSNVRIRSEWEEANFYMKWTFSVANPMISRGMKTPHKTVKDLLLLSQDDLSKPLVDELTNEYKKKRKFFFFLPRLIFSLISAHTNEVIIVHLLAVCEGCTRIASPVVVNYLLQALSIPGPAGRAESYKYAGILGILHLFQTGLHHVLFFMTMRMGWQWKTATTGMIFTTLLRLKGINTVGTGKLVNLISNDVSKFEEFAVMAPFAFISMFELLAILLILIFQLNVASAFAGIGMTVLFIPIQVYLAKQFAKRRTNTAHQTDLRVRYTSELIDGIATVKSYAWENPFFSLLCGLRRKEMACIRQSQTLRAVNQGLFYCIPWVAAFATFSVFWGTGGVLTLPIVFSTLALIQQLRTSIGRQWTRSIETGSEAVASAMRIEAFLSLAESSEKSDSSRAADGSELEDIYEDKKEETHYVRRESTASREDSKVNLTPEQELDLQCGFTTEVNVNYVSAEKEPGHLITIPKSSYYYSESAPAPRSGQPLHCQDIVPILKDVELSLKRGELILVAGPVGAGKSSLLSVILGEMRRCERFPSPDATLIPIELPAPAAPAPESTTQIPDSRSKISGGSVCYRSVREPTSSSSSSLSFKRVAYCAQRPWILAASVRSNIIVAGKGRCDMSGSVGEGHNSSVVDKDKKNEADTDLDLDMDLDLPSAQDEELYALAVESTQVVTDLLYWTDYDNTEIGERGISISGGQKARIALARAVYSDSDVVLLDDPLSAVDARVGSLLFFECILTALRGRGKGVVLATHQLQYMQYADKIVALDKDGQQIFYGTYAELQDRKDVFSILTESIGHGDDDQAAPVTYVTDIIPEPVATTTVRSVPSSPQVDLRNRLGSHPSDQSLPDHLPSNPHVLAPISLSTTNSRAASPPCALYLDSPAITLSPELLQKHFSQSSMEDLAEDARARATADPGSSVATAQNGPVIVAPKYDISLSSRGRKYVNDNEKKGLENLIKVEEPSEKLEIGGKDENEHEEKQKDISQIIVSEDRIEGRLSSRIWMQYLRAGGMFRGLYAITIAVIAQALLMITEYWVRWWVGNTFYKQEDVTNVWILGILTVLCIFIGFYRALSWFEFTLAASSNLHEKSLWAVLHAPLQFFVANPAGRILNRFTKDQSQADENLPITLFDVLQSAFYCISVVLLICISIPYLIILMPFLIYLFNFARNKYLINSIEIKRIEAISRSPIYVDFSSALEGLMTLRGYRLENTANKSFQQQLDRNSRAWFSFLMVSRWLGFRLDLESSVMLICVVFVAVALRDTIDIGLIGFTIIYTLSLSGLLQWTVRQMAEVETQMTSVERISTYADLPPEAGYSATLDNYHLGAAAAAEPSGAAAVAAAPIAVDSEGDVKRDLRHDKTAGEGNQTAVASNPDVIDLYGRQSPSYLSKSNLDSNSQLKSTSTAIFGNLSGEVGEISKVGSLQIEKMTVKYREDFPTPVLNSLSLNIPGGSKVGVIGRTGCGKSSLLLALMRLNIIIDGDVKVDGESVLGMDLEHSRGLFTVIPQDPHLFSGTVRFNLDPFSMYSDGEIWAALESAHIKESIQNDPQGLLKAVEEGGLNFSVGQRQLLSLSRAILRKTKIVLMDEVTASIDYTTDRLIQKTIRTAKSLKDCTIISIAHRLRTVADSDLVVVMVTGGNIGEVGAPLDLLDNPDSLFHRFARETNEFEVIHKIASKSMSRSNSGLFM